MIKSKHFGPPPIHTEVLNAAGEPFAFVRDIILNSSGTAFTVDAEVLDTDGNAFTIFS